MLTQDDALAARQREMQEQAAAGERAYRQNVNRFVEMFLSLGPDCIKIAEGTRFDEQLVEAKGLAANRWNLLLGMEQQIDREEQHLAARPPTRPAQPGDEVLPDRTISQRSADWQVQTKYLHAAHADLKEQAKAERKDLESLKRKW
jgi:hypothetical protein